MANDFVLIIGKRDRERFKRFRTDHYGNIINTIGKFSDIENVWAIGPATDPDIWSKIQKNDRVFFGEFRGIFSKCGIVSGKTTDQKNAIKIWGDSPRMREHKRLILFSSVHSMDVPYRNMCRHAGIRSPSKFTNIYPAKQKIGKTVHVPFQESIPGIMMVSEEDVPNKRSEVVTRFIRESKKARQIKRTYNDECQVCGRVIKISENLRYSEVHHLHPLEEGGDDEFDNMLVLCPTHHVEFDYKTIGISEDKKTVIARDGTRVARLGRVREHVLNEKNIMFHLVGMTDGFS